MRLHRIVKNSMEAVDPRCKIPGQRWISPRDYGYPPCPPHRVLFLHFFYNRHIDGDASPRESPEAMTVITSARPVSSWVGWKL